MLKSFFSIKLRWEQQQHVRECCSYFFISRIIYDYHINSPHTCCAVRAIVLLGCESRVSRHTQHEHPAGWASAGRSGAVAGWECVCLSVLGALMTWSTHSSALLSSLSVLVSVSIIILFVGIWKFVISVCWFYLLSCTSVSSLTSQSVFSIRVHIC